MKTLGKYKNGNYRVAMLVDGSKIRYNDLDFFEPEKPESIDLKATNRCFRAVVFATRIQLAMENTVIFSTFRS